jgi:uncharacterized protein YecE (DUF72 family)
VFYPKGLAAGEFLTHYAEHYPIVEVDSTFYREPSRKMVEGWRGKTPEGFGLMRAAFVAAVGLPRWIARN